MLNSLLMLGSCYNKKYSKYLYLGLLLNLIIVQSNKMSISFLITNAITMTSIVLLSKCFKNNTANSIISILSIMLWSIIIDIISYYAFPFISSSSLVAYILNGVIFNLKYVALNFIVLVSIKLISYIINKNKVNTALEIKEI